MNGTRIFIGAFIILIGLGWLLDVNIFRFLLPIFLIFLGVRILSGREHSIGPNMMEQQVHEDSLNEVVIFSGFRKKYQSTQFTGGKVVAIFGGGEIDLRQVVTTQPNISLEVVAIFGGLKVYIPSDWKVTSEGVGIFGGYTNRMSSTRDAKTQVRVTGVAIFGGVDIVP